MMSSELGASPKGKLSSVTQSLQGWVPSYQALPMTAIGSFLHSFINNCVLNAGYVPDTLRGVGI